MALLRLGADPVTAAYIGATPVAVASDASPRVQIASAALTTGAREVSNIPRVEVAWARLRAAQTASGAVTTPLFRGHLVGQVRLGITAPDTGAQDALPDYADAVDIIEKVGAVRQHTMTARRKFLTGRYTTGNMATMRQMTDAEPGKLMCFSVSGYSGVYNKQTGAVVTPETWDIFQTSEGDADIERIREGARLQRTANGGSGRPFILTHSHEPTGDGDLSTWGLGLQALSNKLAGKTGPGGSYVEADDVRDIVTVCAIHNAFHWGPRNKNPTYAATGIMPGYPRSLVDAFKANGSILMADFYDPSPPADGNGQHLITNYRGTEDRTSRKLTEFARWHATAATGNTPGGAWGAGEIDTTTAAELTNAWQVLRANRRYACFATLFSSSRNSRWEWRAIPSSYPRIRGNPVPDYNPYGLLVNGVWTENGGDSLTEARLTAWRSAIDESKSTTYTGAV